MVSKFRLTDAKPVSTPMQPGVQLEECQTSTGEEESLKTSRIPYSEAIRSLLWAVIVSRPDAAYVVGVLSQFVQNPNRIHWEAVKRVIVYLRSTKNLWLTFGEVSDRTVVGYCDTDWASQPHRHSISGYSFHVGDGAVTWSSKKQQIVALSSTEAEYVSLTHAGKEALWLWTLFREMRGTELATMTINCNNQGSIALTKDNKFHARMKHIDVQYHFIHECIEDGKLEVKYIPMGDNVSDIFTKALPRPKFEHFAKALGLREV